MHKWAAQIKVGELRHVAEVYDKLVCGKLANLM